MAKTYTYEQQMRSEKFNEVLRLLRRLFEETMDEATAPHRPRKIGRKSEKE